ncbi:MAG: hypothetical protein CL917_07690 [Deltaproteobacteria bacterium]|nr:hypothetical protein [Deltaproteobacteria bacterium]
MREVTQVLVREGHVIYGRKEARPAEQSRHIRDGDTVVTQWVRGSSATRSPSCRIAPGTVSPLAVVNSANFIFLPSRSSSLRRSVVATNLAATIGSLRRLNPSTRPEPHAKI